ncbi:MAG: 3'(2'),5'-bisphosphate nucleotidase CysQ [Rhodospirillaceae bacterium]|nr:3'(2'),5'-bisphosphate nucleotidase CysQ [Rhodospirillaceae bacterium]MDE0361105.1 3'(2'),5'-bisphosphate nucleotidase CysQ [Rhodospirillaceae bacterium]
MNFTTVLEEVRTIARAAGDAIMSVYARDFSVELKADRSPVTEADRAADAIISSRLAQLHPMLPVLSEESAPTPWAQRRQWNRYWLVDPLDGTREFVKKNGEFTVNIALVEDHRAVLGVVLAPALNLEFSGARGEGAWRREADGPQIPVRASATAHASAAQPPPLNVMGSRSHPGPGLSAFLARLGPYELKPMGSSLKVCMVADGQADIYPRLGPTSEWDTAAAQAILESAGGGMIDLAGQPLRYNTKDCLLNPHFLAVGDLGRDWLSAVQNS